jgi:DNA-binding HxlR family transcriptional regulator
MPLLKEKFRYARASFSGDRPHTAQVDENHGGCLSFQAAMDVLAKPWTGLVFVALERGPLRFGELRDAVGSIGDRMLSVRLRELEQKRLVRRHVIVGPPVHVEYELTETGRGFRAVSEAVRQWGATILIARDEPPKATSGRRRSAPRQRRS